MIWILWISLIVIGIILFILLVTSLMIFLFAMRAKSPWNQDKKPWVPQINDPQLKERAIKSIGWFGSEGQLVFINAKDGTKLAGKIFLKDNATHNIILFHGYRGKPEGDFCLIHDWLKNEKVNIISIYERGVYPSGGKYITLGVKESDDVKSWTEYVSKLNKLPIILWGMSMGTASILYSLREPTSKRVTGIVADCGFTSIYEQYFNQTAEYSGRILAKFFLFLAGLWCHLFLHFGFKKYDTRKILAKNKIPIFFVHGKADKFVMTYFTQENYDANKGEKSILLVKDAGHMDSFKLQPEAYKKEVRKLLKN